MILTKIFYHVDNFCKTYEKPSKPMVLPSTRSKKVTLRATQMPLSDIMTILIYFHHSGYRNFKKYYTECADLKGAFNVKLSYNRFIEIMSNTAEPLVVFMNSTCAGELTGIGFIDSTKLQVCHNLRINRNKVFKGIAARGKTSTGWFYGFKLHLIINEVGEILSFWLTPGNVADNDKSIVKKLVNRFYGKLFGDRGYISKTLFEDLYERGIKLITKLKKNMKNKLMDISEKLMLQKRGIIESVNGLLKSSCQIEHSRHRSPINFAVHLVAGLVAYSFLEKKPKLRGYVKPLLEAA